MKEKAFELLKELLLLQSAGGGETLSDVIEMTIDIYCELTAKDKEKFKAELMAIQAFVWSKRNDSNFKILQKNYATLIDNMS